RCMSSFACWYSRSTVAKESGLTLSSLSRSASSVSTCCSSQSLFTSAFNGASRYRKGVPPSERLCETQSIDQSWDSVEPSSPLGGSTRIRTWDLRSEERRVGKERR